MILLDGVQYDVQTPEENVENLVNTINEFCTSQDIKNTKDEVIQIEKNWANPLYVLAYGFSYLISAVQNLIYSAGCALSITSSSEKQLLNIADISNTKRKLATKTTITAIVYSNITSDDAVDCNITTALSLTVPVSGINVVFHPAFDITVPIGEARTIVLVAEELGSYNISANNEAQFDENPEGFRAMYCYQSIPGQDIEAIPSLRNRIQRKSVSGTKQDRAAEAIGQLDGVSVCNIYFNKGVNNDEVVMGITVPPRQSLIFVQGFSSEIAKTYWSYMDAPCAGQTESTAIEQVYTTRSGQDLPVYIIPPKQRVVYIRLYFNQVVNDTTKQTMRDTIATLSASLTIGERLTSSQVLEIIRNNFTEEPAGCQLSLDNGVYSYQVKPAAYELLVFSVDPAYIQIGGV